MGFYVRADAHGRPSYVAAVQLASLMPIYVMLYNPEASAL